jgi:hypothetical protein
MTKREEPDWRRDVALRGEILRGVVGSTAHGTGMDGHEDRDEMGVCIEPPEAVCGLRQFEQYIYRDKPEGVRSGPGDLDLVIYGLRKFCRLAAQGNPSVVLLLWLPEYITITEIGRDLVDMRLAFLSRESGARFLGYLSSQKTALKGERNKKVTRPELVEQFGYDTKFAMHALRLGLQGIEYLTDYRLSEPVREPDRTLLRDVRYGRVPFVECLKLIDDAEARLRELVEATTASADYDRINRFLVSAHARHWA